MARAPEPAWFTASEDRLFKAAVQTAMALGYSVKHTDPSMRVIAFNTGMSMRSWAGQDMSVSVVQGDGGRNGVTIGGTRAQLALGGVPQVFDWGERGKIVRTFLQKFEEILPRTAIVPAPIAAPTATEFEADGVYSGIPYKANGTAVQALMGGTVVRFRTFEHFTAAASGQTAR